MTGLSDARVSIAKKAIIDANGDAAKAYAVAEKYYSEFAGRLPSSRQFSRLFDL